MMSSIRLIVILALLSIALAASLPAAQSLSQEFCSNLFPASPFSSQEGVIGIAFLIMLVMLVVAGVAYALGYAFQIESFMRFSRTEMGEVGLTALIIAIFAGFIFASNAATLVPSLTPSQAQGYFTSDCGLLSGASTNVFVTLATYYWPNLIKLGLIQGISVKIAPSNFGLDAFGPFAGYDLLISAVNKFAAFTGFLATALIGMVALLAIIYAIFPMFLYAGIVLRTIPFTRAAGGAFLGFFIGFYLMFPMMLYMLLSAYPNIAATSSIVNSPPSSALSSLFGATVTGADNLINAIGTLSIEGEIQNFATLVIDPMFYTIGALMISVLVSFDFSELVSGLLGSPSLSSREMFKKLL